MFDNYKKIYTGIFLNSLLYGTGLIFIDIILIKTNSILFGSIALSIFYVPAIFSFVVGPLTDSIKNKKLLFALSDIFKIVVLFFIIIDLLNFSFYNYIIFLLLLFTLGLLSTFSSLSFMAIQKHIINDEQSKKYFKNLHSIIFISSIIGLLFLGVLLTYSYIYSLLFMLIVYVLSAYALLTVDVNGVKFETKKFSLNKLKSIKDGIIYLKNNNIIKIFTILAIFNGAAMAMVMPLIVFISKDIIKVNAIILTSFYVFSLTGSFIGTFFASKIKTESKKIIYEYYTSISFLFIFIYYIIYISHYSIYSIYFVLFIAGFMESILSLFHSIINFKYIDKNMTGSVYGLKNTLNSSVYPLSNLAIGFILSFYILKYAFVFISIIFSINFFILLFLKIYNNKTFY